MTKKNQAATTCGRCNGTGHDKNSHPVVKFEPQEQEDGSMKRVHLTLKRGSGCMGCLGTGVKA